MSQYFKTILNPPLDLEGKHYAIKQNDTGASYNVANNFTK